MQDCLFCMIAKGDIPSNKVYEDESVLAFRDINPQAPTHILVIPKEHIADSATHIQSVSEINGENSSVVAHIFEVIAKIAAQEGLDEGFRVITNSGKAAGQTVPHLHFHILAGTEMAEKLI